MSQEPNKAPPPNAARVALCQAKENAEAEVTYYQSEFVKAQLAIKNANARVKRILDKLSKHEADVHEITRAMEELPND